MKLNEEKKKIILEKLNDIWPPKKRICPICDGTKFEISDSIFQLGQYFPHKLVFAPVVPLLVITCVKCGYTILFNAITLQVIKRKPIIKTQEDEVK